LKTTVSGYIGMSSYPVPTAKSSWVQKIAVKDSDKDSTDGVSAGEIRQMMNPKGAVHAWVK